MANKAFKFYNTIECTTWIENVQVESYLDLNKVKISNLELLVMGYNIFAFIVNVWKGIRGKKKIRIVILSCWTQGYGIKYNLLFIFFNVKFI